MKNNKVITVRDIIEKIPQNIDKIKIRFYDKEADAYELYDTPKTIMKLVNESILNGECTEITIDEGIMMLSTEETV